MLKFAINLFHARTPVGELLISETRAPSSLCEKRVSILFLKEKKGPNPNECVSGSPKATESVCAQVRNENTTNKQTKILHNKPPSDIVVGFQ